VNPTGVASIILSAAVSVVSAQSPTLVSATFLGTDGDDLIESVAIAPDKTIYVAGNTAKPVPSDFGGVRVATMGSATESSRYGCGFVARFNADATKLLAYTQWSAGQVKLTTVAVNSNGVYAAGYATPPLRFPTGFQPAHPASQVPPHFTPKEHTERSNPQPDKSLAGAPVVMWLTHDLAGIGAGTFLEGQHTIWHVPRPLGEDTWQPTGLALLSNGDVVVCHDGGPIVPTKPGESPGAFHFYFCPDHLSRLSPELTARRWKQDIYSPAVEPVRASKGLGREWAHPTLGNARSFRIRSDARDNVYLAGWAASRTTIEPWWSPYLRKYDSTGRMLWSAYEFDPTSGKDERLNGLVSDSAIRSVAIDEEGNPVICTIGDGGNSVLRRDPRDYTQPAPSALRGSVSGFKGRVLYWGGVMRLNAVTRELLGGNHLGASNERGYQATWAVDVAPLPGGNVLAVGRHTAAFRVSSDAWFQPRETGGFIKLYAKDFAETFTTSIPDADFFMVTRQGNRCVIVGAARTGQAPTKNAVFQHAFGKQDGYLLVVDCP
jgi:hypothetical protein